MYLKVSYITSAGLNSSEDEVELDDNQEANSI